VEAAGSLVSGTAAVTLRNRYFALVGGLALVAFLAACGDNAVRGPIPTAGLTPTGGTTEGRPTTTATSPDSPDATASASAAPVPGLGFVLVEGAQRDICGVRLRATFIPPSVTAGGDDQAFLVGGPIPGNHEAAPAPTGDQPLPSTVAPARTGATATVMGKRFKVVAVDVANRRVQLEPLC
jgi:hypothetical protein